VKVTELPARSEGFVTFGCLNNFCKVNAETLKLWARVLCEVDGSRLLLLCPPGRARERAAATLEGEGVERNRIEFVGTATRQQYLERFHGVDIALDPFPYNGHTTSLDALWMGVPVISLAGSRAVSRAGWSQLSNLGLSEWVAISADEYVRAASGLAGDWKRLEGFRATLRERMERSLLMDGERFTRSIEAVYRTVWRRWCAKGSS
jgi:predicted O-linked N-acetylglucosamine transferase (SPINDLY family)